jgi:hypothetical protein
MADIGKPKRIHDIPIPEKAPAPVRQPAPAHPVPVPA